VLADNAFTVTVTIQGLPADLDTNVYVNGNYNSTLAGGASATYTLSNTNSPYTISIDSYVQGTNNGTRYYCQNTAWQTNSSGTQIFTYLPQYFLAVQTPYGSADGQGWYTSGSTAHATVSDQDVPEGQGTRNIFSGWTGDATGSQLASNAITMDGPKVAVANWTTQFLLAVESDPPNATGLSGSGWYNSNTQANFSASMVIPETSTTRLEFDHWSGEFTGQQIVGSILMDRPKTVKADYLAQYLLAVQYSPVNVAGSYNETHAGWYDTNSDVQLGPAPATITLSAVERLQFTGWSDSGSLSNNLSYTILVDRPRNITLSYTTQYYVEVQSGYGTFSGSGWYDRGATATITGPTEYGTWPISHTLTGWTVDPPSEALTDNGGSWAIVVNGPYVVQAQWGLNYFPLILLFCGAVIGATAAVGGFVGYKRGAFRRPSMPKPQKTQLTPSTHNPKGTCNHCGSNISNDAEFCEKCGAAVSGTQHFSVDDRVYDYIVNHQGVISLGTASTDLGMPVEQLKEITERLKGQGRLS